jgi:superfamily II DNA helicase RecQ
MHWQGYISRHVFHDEGHLPVEWQDFRTAYRGISGLRAVDGAFSGVQYVALTATANVALRAEMKRVLGLGSRTTVVVGDSDRANCK